MKIQFICSANVFRSRMAEAYLKSKNISNLIVSSSGIRAQEGLDGLVCKETIEILKKHDLIQFLSKGWTQTNKKDIEDQDIVIFMENVHYEYCYDLLNCNILNYEIWNVKDVPNELQNMEPEPVEEILAVSEKIFQEIKNHVDILLKKKLAE